MNTRHQSAIDKTPSVPAISDRELMRTIRERLGTAAGRLLIRVERGDVYLDGVVSKSTEAQVLTAIVQHVPGVKVVRAQLKTSPQETRPALQMLKPRRRPIGALKSVLAMSVVLCTAIVVVQVVGSEWSNGGLVPAEIVIRVNDQPAPGMFIRLHPRSVGDTAITEAKHPIGAVQNDGRVVWTTLHPGDGVPAGQYIVTAIWHRPVPLFGEFIPGPNLLPTEFGVPDKSPLRLKIRADDAPQSFTIDLVKRSFSQSP